MLNNDDLKMSTDTKIENGAQFNTCEKKIEFHCNAGVLLGNSCSLSSGATFTVTTRVGAGLSTKNGPYLPEPEVRYDVYLNGLL